MQHSYVEVNGVKTKIMTFGNVVREDGVAEDMIVMIPGNPGITRFYTMFLQTIYERLHVPIWIIGHVGHDIPPKWMKDGECPPLKGNESLFALQGQVEHKVCKVKNNNKQNVISDFKSVNFIVNLLLWFYIQKNF